MHAKAQSKEATASTRNLLADPDDSSSDGLSQISDPIWLILTTKKHMVDQRRLKPGKISLPHSLNSSATIRICLFTADPQRAFKDTVAHPSFPTDLTPRITRIMGISKLKARYKSFESRRQLLAEHDIFLADSRIVTMLPNILGKTFYKGPKRPMPVNFEPPKPKDPTTGKRRPRSELNTSAESPRAVTSPKALAQEIGRALSSTQIHLSPSPTTAIRVGLASFTPEQLAANIEMVVNGMVERFVAKGWRNVRSIHIKGPNTLAIPIWLAEELWMEETDVLEDAEAKRREEIASQKGKRKGREAKKDDGVGLIIQNQPKANEQVEKESPLLQIEDDKLKEKKKKRKAEQSEGRESVQEGNNFEDDILKKKKKRKAEQSEGRESVQEGIKKKRKHASSSSIRPAKNSV